jgi:predicted component of type VI protein secretion system
MLEIIKYTIEGLSGVMSPIFSGAILYYMVVMQTKIVRIEENLKNLNTKMDQIEKFETKIHQLIIKNGVTSVQVQNIDKRVVKIEKDVELLKRNR